MKRILKVGKTIKIEDGRHTGTITKLIWRARPYDYVDLNIVFKNNDQNVELKAGFPAIITENTKLGQLLMRFGMNLEYNKEIDVEKAVINQTVTFHTYTESNDKGLFAKIYVNTIKPKGVAP